MKLGTVDGEGEVGCLVEDFCFVLGGGGGGI